MVVLPVVFIDLTGEVFLFLVGWKFLVYVDFSSRDLSFNAGLGRLLERL